MWYYCIILISLLFQPNLVYSKSWKFVCWTPKTKPTKNIDSTSSRNNSPTAIHVGLKNKSSWKRKLNVSKITNLRSGKIIGISLNGHLCSLFYSCLLCTLLTLLVLTGMCTRLQISYQRCPCFWFGSDCTRLWGSQGCSPN